MANVKTIASWSGGKDSCLACYKVIKEGYDIRYLLNFVSSESRRGSFHGLDKEIISLQAERINLSVIIKEVSPDTKKYESEFKSAVSELINTGIEAMVFGDIYLEEHKVWVDRVCQELNIKPLEPLWKQAPMKLLQDFLDAGFKTIIVSCRTELMGKEYLGRYLDMELAEELQEKGICPCGEKGEFHTLVLDGPIFKKPIEILEAQPILKESFWQHWYLDIKRYS